MGFFYPFKPYFLLFFGMGFVWFCLVFFSLYMIIKPIDKISHFEQTEFLRVFVERRLICLLLL